MAEEDRTLAITILKQQYHKWIGSWFCDDKGLGLPKLWVLHFDEICSKNI